MKILAHLITGLIFSTFSYITVVFGGVAISHFTGYPGQAQALMNLSTHYLIYNVFAGMFGGFIGGTTSGYNGAMIGGVIAGILAGATRLILVYFV